jgi:hypothetical protein
METTTYIDSFDNFILEDNHILVEDDALANANHILILMNSSRNFGLLCASKPTETTSGNDARMEKLQQDVIKLKCSYIPFKYGLNYASAGESIVRNENSCLCIQGIELEELLELAAKYEQSTAVYGNKDEIKSYDVQSGKPDIILGAVDMKLAMATVLFYPGTFR